MGRMTGAVGTGTPGLRRRATQSHIKIMPHLELLDDEAAALIKELHDPSRGTAIGFRPAFGPWLRRSVSG